ncbi:MAG: hypothetical protein GX100_12135 [candidate division WS1 bacterium]|nr:hypothetical protein [candidate division WS1 bacterium]
MPDEFDIDVEALAGETEEPQPAPESTSQPATKAAEKAAAPTPRVLSAHKPGPLQKLTSKVRAPLTRLKLPEWNLRTFLQLLGIILVLWFLLENWPPARVKVLIWDFDAPKTVLFLFNVILGALLLRGWQIFLAQRAARRAEAEAAAEAAQSEAE